MLGLDMALAGGNKFMSITRATAMPRQGCQQVSPGEGPGPDKLHCSPLSSVYAEAAQAVPGWFFGDVADRHQPSCTQSRIYDFGDRTELVPAYYQRAIDDGAEMVIGPLGKKGDRDTF
ncbi:MAG: hypothetical protein CM1200mP20_17020 [Pseudomonadota bacterium]|nr:MAG: hypothetical protein CM1200mP20_17020 [Pseudomonadota bacterium]